MEYFLGVVKNGICVNGNVERYCKKRVDVKKVDFEAVVHNLLWFQVISHYMLNGFGFIDI